MTPFAGAPSLASRILGQSDPQVAKARRQVRHAKTHASALTEMAVMRTAASVMILLPGKRGAAAIKHSPPPDDRQRRHDLGRPVLASLAAMQVT